MNRLQGSAAGSACDIKEKKSTNSNTTKEWLQLKSIPAHIYKMAHSALIQLLWNKPDIFQQTKRNLPNPLTWHLSKC